jgi:teichuronic acid biosynthesis glycosyltransferase TuaC
MKTALVDRAVKGVMPTAMEGVNAAQCRTGTNAEADGNRPIRILVFTSLYPNAVRPRHGVFVEERLRQLVAGGKVTATVVAPVPWFPFRHPRFGAYAAFAEVPEREERYGIRILHPRYPLIPKLGMSLAPLLMYRALLPMVQRLLREDPDYDLIDAHYFYPDGVAAVHIGCRIGKPVVVTARGTDVTLIPRYRLPRRQILRAAQRAAVIITVSQALRDKLVHLGAAAEKVTVLRNGVDLERFGLLEAGALRAKLGLKGTVWLSVGNLVELKGVHLTLAALAELSDVTLLIAGEGREEHNLRQLAQRLRVRSRVRFLGNVPHAELADYYNAADVLVLASSREGMPNVVLEALACGTPVIATPVEGVAELITAPEAGQIAEDRTAAAIVAAWRRLQLRPPERAATRRFAERLGWGPTVEAQHALYASVLRNAHSPVKLKAAS